MESTLLRHLRLYTKEQVLLLEKLCNALYTQPFFIPNGYEDQWWMDLRSSYGEGGDDYFLLATTMPKRFLLIFSCEEKENIGQVTWAFNEEGTTFRYLNLVTGDNFMSLEQVKQLEATKDHLRQQFDCPINSFPGHFSNTAKDIIALSQ
ncbi:MAG TPA: hypothetical protein VL576_01080 [Candidatus Paceibacterota bacterium]|jgi:hypothetical protein|nr:hypothetical protein [Candidatus Paceibacterota bacterium]